MEYSAVQVSRNMVQLNVNNNLQNVEARLTDYGRSIYFLIKGNNTAVISCHSSDTVKMPVFWELPSCWRRMFPPKRRYTFTTLYESHARKREIFHSKQISALSRNAHIKIQAALHLPATCLGFLDVSASLMPVKQ